jgi:hypothetical protein
MPDSAVKLNVYSLSYATPEEFGMTAEALTASGRKPLKLVLCGECFFIRAADPLIKVGDIEVKNFEIKSDKCNIICYLNQVPEEGALISIDYGSGQQATMDEPFSMQNLNKNVSGEMP